MKGTKYSCYGLDGNHHALWTWHSTVEMLAKLLNDPEQSKQDKDRAAEILRWCAERTKTMDPDLADFMNELDASVLWDHPDQFELRDVENNGKTTRQCVEVIS